MAADLEFRIGAELSEIKGALAALKRDFAAVGVQAQQAGRGANFSGLESSVGRAAGAVGRLVAGFVGLATVIKLVGAADELNTLNARIKIVSGSTQEFERAQQALFEMSQRTRTGLGETVALYTRIAQATKDAGVGQEVLLGVVETINQAVQLSGASTQAAEAALVQLGQGLASGTLRGEELNSVLEQTPVLADAIAKGLGITRGELRQYGQDGKLTAEGVLKALQSQKDVIAQQFAQLPLTVGQSVTLLKNAGLQLLGAFDQSASATKGLAGAIKDLADFLSSDEAIGAIIEFAATWSNAFALIVGDVKAAVQIIREATANIVGDGDDLIGFLARAFRELPLNIRTAVQIVAVQIAVIKDRIIAEAQFIKEAIAAIFNDDTIDAAAARYRARLAAIEGAARDTIDGALAERQKAIDDAAKARAEAEQRRQRARSTPGSNAQGTFKKTLTDEEKRKAEALRKAELDSEAKLEKDQTDRLKGILSDYYEDALISTAAYYEARERIELQGVENALAIERRRLAGTTDAAERVKILTEIELLERQKTDIQTKGARDRANALKALERELDQARAQEFENQGQAAEAAKIRLEAQYRDLIKRLQAEGNTEGVKLIQRLIDTGVAKAQFDQIKQQFDDTVAALQRRQAQIADQQKTGALSPETAQQQSRQAQDDARAKLEELNAKLQVLAADPNALPGVKRAAEEAQAALRQLAIDGLTGIDAAIVTLRASLDNLQKGFAQAATGAGVDALTGFFKDLASGSKTAGEAIRDFARNFIASMVDIAARALATYLVLQLLESVFPGAGRLVAGVGGATAGVKHSGGMVGQGTLRAVNPLVFAGAPRYHAGGLVGLKPDERPAILQTGEEVLSRDDPRNRMNGGGVAGGTNVRIVNAIDPELAGEFFNTPAGEKVFFNLISRNNSQVRNLLGV